MYTLRDPSFTYQACNAADVRRPRTPHHSLDPRWVANLAQTMCRDDDNRRAITNLVRDAVGHVGDGPALYERFSELVVCGRIVLREVMPPDVYPLSDPARSRAQTKCGVAPEGATPHRTASIGLPTLRV